MDGIGYVWIIRVYLICALLTPFAVKLGEHFKNGYMKYFLLLLLYLAYEISVYFGFDKLNAIFGFVIAYLIPYGIIYVLGMRSKTTKMNYYDFLMSGIFLMIFIVSLIAECLSAGEFVPLRVAKYPPTIYFLSYSLFVGFLLLGILKKIKLKENLLIKFLSRSSLWIYLWHILMLAIVGYFRIPFWLVNYALVVTGACLIMFIQNKVVDYLSQKKMVGEKFLAVFRG